MHCVEIGEVQYVLFAFVVEVLRNDLVETADVSICAVSEVVAHDRLEGLESWHDRFATVGHMSPRFALVDVKDLVPCLVFREMAFRLKAAQHLVEDLVLPLLGLREKGAEREWLGLSVFREVDDAAECSLARLH